MHLEGVLAKQEMPNKSTALQKRDWDSFICKTDDPLNIPPELNASVDTVNTGLLTQRRRWCTGLNALNTQN